MHANTFLIRRLLATLAFCLLTAAWMIALRGPSARGQGAGSGEVDPVFGGASLGLAGNVLVTAVPPDGRVLVGGLFQSDIARLNPDGSTDNGFKPVGVGNVTALAVQADDKVLAAGGPSNLTRLNADGSLDASFTTTVDLSVNGVRILIL